MAGRVVNTRALVAVCTLAAAAANVEAQAGLGDPFVRVYYSQGASAEHVAILLGQGEGGSLPMEQAVSLYPAADGEAGLGVWLELDLDDLTPSEPDSQCLLDVVVYLLHGGASIATSMTRVVDVGCSQPPDAYSGVRFLASFSQAADSLSPGEYRVRSLISDRASKAFAVRESAIAIPAAGAPAATGIAVEGLTGWFDVSLDPGSAMPPIAPSTRVGVPLAAPWSIRILARGVTAPGIQVNRPNGESSLLETEWIESVAPGGWTELRTDLLVSEGEDLRVVVVDNAPAPTAPLSSPLSIVPRSQAPGAFSWVAGRRGGSESEAPATVASDQVPTQQSRSRLNRRRFEQELRDAIGAIAADSPSSQGAVAAVERRAIVDDGALVDEVARAELRVFESLIDDDPRSVLPILQAYLHDYERHLASKEYILSTHARRIATTLAHSVLDRAGTDRSIGELVGSFYAAFGGSRLLNHDPFGRQLLRTALELVPDPMPSLAVLAWHLEVYGEYSDLIRLVDAHSDVPPEVRLRRALAAVRLYPSGGAMEELDRIAVGSDWTALLAVQEIVRLRIADGEFATAEAMLTEALPRFPNSSRLPLLLAMVRDLRSDRTASAEAIDLLRKSGSANERHRYSQRPGGWVDIARREFEAQATAARPSLVMALENGS